MPSKQKQSCSVQKQVQLMLFGKKKQVHWLLPSPVTVLAVPIRTVLPKKWIANSKSVLLYFKLIPVESSVIYCAAYQKNASCT